MTSTPLVVDPTTDPRWAAVAALRPDSLFHSPPWLAAVADTYDFDLRAAVLPDDRAGLAYCTLDDALGRRTVSVPFTDACDPLVTTADEWQALAAAVIALDEPWTIRTLDDRIAAADPRFRVAKRLRWHRLALVSSSGAQWAGLHGSARRAVRKARTGGVEVRPLPAGSGVDDFLRLHRGLRRTKYGMLAQPRAFFANLEARFEPLDAWHPLGAYLGDRLVAATVYLRQGDALFYKFNASDPAALDLRPNNLLLWEGAELARALGCHTLDLGPSDDDQPGLIRFKAQTGAVEHEVQVLSYRPPGWAADPAADRLRASLGHLTARCTAPGVSDVVAADASDAVYRYFA